MPEDVLRAIGLFARACEANVAEGCAELGALLYEGRRVPRDLERARGLLHKACDAGVSAACETLEADAAADAGAPTQPRPVIRPARPAPVPLRAAPQKEQHQLDL